MFYNTNQIYRKDEETILGRIEEVRLNHHHHHQQQQQHLL